MPRSLKPALLLLSALGLLGPACRRTVPFQPNPAAIADPLSEVQTLARMRAATPVKVELVGRTLEETWANPSEVYKAVLPLDTSELRITEKGGAHQVSAHDAAGKEIWLFLPADGDLATCKRMVDALTALKQRAGATPGTPR